MKTLLMAATLMLSSFAFAGTGKDQVQRTIDREIVNPVVNTNNNLEGTVLISFSYDEFCNLNVTELNYSDVTIAAYVVQKLANITPDDAVKGKVYNYRFNFTKE